MNSRETKKWNAIWWSPLPPCRPWHQLAFHLSDASIFIFRRHFLLIFHESVTPDFVVTIFGSQTTSPRSASAAVSMHCILSRSICTVSGFLECAGCARASMLFVSVERLQVSRVQLYCIEAICAVIAAYEVLRPCLFTREHSSNSPKIN